MLVGFTGFIRQKGPWVELRYSSTLSRTTALEVNGEGGVLAQAPATSTHGKVSVPTVHEAGRSQGRAGQVWKNSPPPGSNPGRSRP